ncbi:MAG: RNA polymerase sigma factor [Akkermansiaceae bacterium]|nr:RNA polymerase sigma factor [Akkermansiaceae bacterium]
MSSTQVNITPHFFASAGPRDQSSASHKVDNVASTDSVCPPASRPVSTPDWGKWLTENGSRMLLFARQQTRNAQDAEDVLQDALIKLAKKVQEGSFEGGPECWRPFLYITIRRLAIDLGRKNDRRVKRENKSEADRYTETGGLADPWFHGDGSNGEAKALLEEELKKLPAKFSEVIIMKVWGNHTFAQIGEMLGVSLNTVASRYRYGLERLRKALETNRASNDI